MIASPASTGVEKLVGPLITPVLVDHLMLSLFAEVHSVPRDPRPIDVVIVEDDPGDVLLIQEALELQGHTRSALVARDGHAAVRFLHREGEHAATTSQDPNDILASYSVHANAYVTRPVNLDDFTAAVGHIHELHSRIGHDGVGHIPELDVAAQGCAPRNVEGCLASHRFWAMMMPLACLMTPLLATAAAMFWADSAVV